MKYIIKNVSCNQELEKMIHFYKKIFRGVSDVDNPVYSLEQWTERMKKHNDLMFYASLDQEVIGIVFARVTNTGSMIVGPVAVSENYRGAGITREMVVLLEKRAMEKGIQNISLGAVESAEMFYSKLGYEGSLLIQSQNHSIEQLRSLKSKYKVAFTNTYDKKVSQVCLLMKEADKTLEHRYTTEFPGSYTMMLYQKKLDVNKSCE